MLLAFIFVMSGVGSDAECDMQITESDTELSAATEYVLSTDYDVEEVFSSDEGNIFSSLSTTHNMRNPRVNIRRKCGSNGWDFIASDFYLIPRQVNSLQFVACSTHKLYYDSKDYLIRLRKFII